MKTNLKLSVFDSFPYKRLREVCDKICELGFVCEFVSNGNIVFTDISKEKKTEKTGILPYSQNKNSPIDALEATAVARNYLEENYGNINMLLFRIKYARPNDAKDQFHVLCSLLHSFGSVKRLYYQIKMDINDGSITEVIKGEEKGGDKNGDICI